MSRPCRICALDQVEELNAVGDYYREAGEKAPLSKMYDWLVEECGVNAQHIAPRNIGDHFYNRHHITKSVTRTG